ncbi:uncharacterized protein LOC135323859 isoform X2 [Dromaius novaehollandiae]|uniref:uncharacterized protein LOC135323843 isoform X2 n=2 Tax=Dromaius novaehollandiae TaxID=8790 RepID=UPI00311FA88A
MVRARGASGPGRRLLLLLGLLAALRARDSRAAPRAAPGPDVAVFDDYPAAQLHRLVEPLGLPRGRPRALEPRGVPRGVPAGGGLLGSQLDPTSEPQGHARNVAAGDGYAASHLDAHVESLGNRTGPRQRKYKAQRGKSSEKYSKLLQEILKELQRAADVPQVSEASAASQGLKPLLEPQGDRRGLAGDKDAEAAAHKGRRKQRLVLSTAVSGSILFAVVLTCVVTFRLRKRKQEANPAAASNREESSTEEGRAKPGSRTEKDELAVENENLNSSSRRLPVPIPNRIKNLCPFRRE